MGAYLSAPVTAKESADEASPNLECGSSSMQGWRVMQEDAHNCILDFDSNASLFAVYDGHGGPEVAKYCAQKLPQFIKDTEAYRKGEFAKALEHAFLDFDATISDPEIIKLLKTLATHDGPETATDEGSDEEDNIHNLCEEARMPLEEVMAKYEKVGTIVSHLKGESCSSKPLSPKLRSRKQNVPADAVCSSSSSSKINSDETDPVSSTSEKLTKPEEVNESQVSTSNGIHNSPDSPAPGISSTDDTKAPKDAAEKIKNIPKVESSNSNEAEELNSKSVSEAAPEGCEAQNSKESSKTNNQEIATSEPSKSSGSSGQSKSSSRSAKERPPGLYNSFFSASDDSDSNDENFEGETGDWETSSDEETAVNGVNGDSSDEDVDEEDSSDIEMEEDDDEMDNFALRIKNEPGSNSGCTAVVALLHDDQLYVANAGDSRCVVCRNGKAYDMSVDHKPEDPLELQRITKAGGRVSLDGRVNRGLNLSRAIGDLGYKQNHELGPKEQMITAFPDVTTLTIDPETDSFMVLACDGIWNYMSSQNVIDFISERIASGTEKLSQICEEMFDHCLAPNAIGDGTGCDNMTAVIIKFKTSLKKTTENVTKRPSEDLNDETEAKRSKTDNENADVTSSV